MGNSSINNYTMIFMFIIIIYLVINQKKYSKKFDNENFALQPEDLSIIRNEINRVYDMDVESIHNLGTISKSLLSSTNIFSASTGTPGNATIPVDNTILKSGLTLENSTWEKTANSSGKGNSVGYIVSDNANYKTLMIVGNNTAGGARKVSVWDELNVNADTNVTGNLNINSNIGLSYYTKLTINGEQKWKRTDKNLDVTYTNNSGRPINVCVSIRLKSGTYVRVQVDFLLNDKVILSKIEYNNGSRGSGWDRYGSTDTIVGFDIIVPNKATYSVTGNKMMMVSGPSNYGSLFELVSWCELS